MNAKECAEKMSKILENLNPNEQQLVIERLCQSTKPLCEAKDILSKRKKIVLQRCPNCSDIEHVVGNGVINDRQQFWCKKCDNKYGETNGTILYRMHKYNLLTTYFECMSLGLSLRKSAKITGISFPTSFYWRHKVLAALDDFNANLDGIVEVCELDMDYSEKGTDCPIEKPENLKVPAKVMIGMDRNQNLAMELLGRGKATIDNVESFIKEHIKKEDIICYSKNNNTTFAANRTENEHYIIDSSKKKLIRKSCLHLDNVKTIPDKLFSWMERFKGVATKYLQNYLNWFIIMQRFAGHGKQLLEFMEVCLKSNKAWTRYRFMRKQPILVEST